MKRINVYGIISAQILLASTAVQAQEVASPTDANAAVADSSTEGDGLAEIIVTAQRRSENLQKVPIVVSVATSEELAQSGVNNIQDLKILTPGLEVQSNTGYALPIIRGVGSKGAVAGFEPPIATYVDGVYYANATANIFKFNNIAQVEVLKGPQGTLFGRNATGGLIQIITRDPEQTFSGEVELGYGNYDTKNGNVYLTGGLSESLSADISVQGAAQGNGWGTNFFNGEDVYKNHHDVSVRSKWLWQPGSNTEIRATFDYSDQKNSLGTQRSTIGAIPLPALGLPYGGDPWDTNVNTQPTLTLKTGGVSLKIDHDLDAVKLSSITAYRRSKFFIGVDADYTGVDLLSYTLRQTDWQFSQELQILSNNTSSRLSWVVGAYYFLASGEYQPFQIKSFGKTIRTVFDEQKTDSISGFGQATLAVTDALNITGGLRYTSEKRSLDFPLNPGLNFPLTPVLVNQSKRFNKLTWRASIDYTFADGFFGYASYNRGFKSGGFNSINPFLPELAYGPETLDAYEVGFKSTFLDRRVRLNAAGFYYNYDKVQVQRLLFGGNGIYNGPTAKIRGFDVDLQTKLTSQLNLDIGYQYLHGRYSEFPGLIQSTRLLTGGFGVTAVNAPAGKTVVFTPESTVSVRANYKVPLAEGGVNFNVSYYYNSGYYPEPDNVLREDAYSTLNLSAKWSAPDERVSVGLWMNNVTNEAVANIHGIQPFGGGVGGERISYAAPRTFGITLGSKF